MKADPAPGRLGDVGVGAAMRSEEKAEEGGVKAQRRGDWVVGGRDEDAHWSLASTAAWEIGEGCVDLDWDWGAAANCEQAVDFLGGAYSGGLWTRRTNVVCWFFNQVGPSS